MRRSWTSPVQAHLEHFAPVTALSHNRVRLLKRAERDKSGRSMESVELCPRELTGENSPLYAYQPIKMKTDRVLTKYLFRWYCRWKTNACLLPDRPRRKGCYSRKEEVELLVCSVTRCLGNAAEPVDQTLDAVPDRDRRTSAVAREFRARDAFEFELRQ